MSRLLQIFITVSGISSAEEGGTDTTLERKTYSWISAACFVADISQRSFCFLISLNLSRLNFHHTIRNYYIEKIYIA